MTTIDERILTLVAHMREGSALSIPGHLDHDKKVLTLCRARRGAGRRIGKKVFVDQQIAGVREELGDKKVGLVARVIRMEADYFLEFLDPRQDQIDGLTRQKSQHFLVFDQDGKPPARNIVSENEPTLWAQVVRLMLSSSQPPGDEAEWNEAIRVFLNHGDDPKKLMRTFREFGKQA